MQRDEYEKRLHGFEQLVSMARTYSAILETVIQTDEETRGVLNTYVGFFDAVRVALHNGMLLETAKALDKDCRTASLLNLVRAAQDSPEFAPGVNIGAMQEWLVKRAAFIEGLQALRNKQLAHHDVPAELPGGLIYGEFKDMLEELNNYWMALYRAHHGVAAVMDPRTRMARQDAEALRQTLLRVRREQHRRADEYLSALDQ